MLTGRITVAKPSMIQQMAAKNFAAPIAIASQVQARCVLYIRL